MRRPDFPVYSMIIIEYILQQKWKVKVEPVIKYAVHEKCDYSALAAIRLHMFIYAHCLIFYGTRNFFAVAAFRA